MKKLALFLMFGVVPAFGQVYNGTAFQKMPGNWVQAIPLAQITVCTSTASGNPCSPAATLYTDKSLTIQANSNIVSADSLGNYIFYAQSGVYFVCVSGGTQSRCDYVSIGGFSCGTTASPGIPIWNGTACLVDTNATDDGNGNITASTLSIGTLNTTGTGFTQTFQSQAAPNGTFLGNMAAGQMVWYGDSSTLKWTCLNKDGSSCSPGGAAFSGITAGANTNAGAFSATGNSWDFTATTFLGLRVGAGAVSTKNGDQAYDTTNKMWHIWQNAADNFLLSAVASGSFTDQNCVKLVKSGSTINLADSGGACGGSGSASVLQWGCGVSISNTATDFCGVGSLGTSEAGMQTPVSRAGTVSNLQCRIGGAGLSSSQTITITLRKGSAGIGLITSADTTSTCTLNSTNTSGCSDGTHNFAVLAGDVLDIKTVPANTPAVGIVTCSASLL